MPAIDVSLTVDVEFNIGGAFADPDAFAPVGLAHVDCPAEGEDHGLPFLLRILGRHGFRGVFFVETVQAAWFGEEPMKSVVARLLEAGQDVQLHLHPCWTWFRHPDWRERLRRAAPLDDCAALPPAELAELMTEGAAALERWGAPRPAAFRAGGLKAGLNVHRAMKLAGIGLGSSVGLGYAPPRDPEILSLASGVREPVEGVRETPVTSYLAPSPSGGTARRLLTVTGTSFAEMRGVLEQAAARGISPVTILTHPFEFVKHAPPGFPGVRPNRLNKARFRRLCAYLAARPDLYRVTSFAEGASRWRVGTGEDPPLRASPAAAFGRLAANALNDRLRRL
ncbi:hypothetical protein [Neomegalonema sp.]|uniref:hypothetical protein n=1 Tax=Neomegalonema sp. TaxID=2039713 RepID=UPI00262F811A|nr:hypothetical protein [Neomegalonema sp.]MDD2867668.1 hypothetical protein [Neomegalonema sp.]